ncbi:RyPTPR4a [Oopsacas minuta]|uniref:RyPTPR4a n=1 Tax=Oopsacas minuta TaxID=111878 RepID=A0AAV7KBS7_9METZ|nr:RyPTPR4a [Oopsacas minuta]
MNQFAATYKQYIESGIGKNSLLFVEFENLNEQSKKIEELEFEEALKMENTKNIIPFDSNRVVLNSIHFDCNYINASWLESHQFIATINPTKETHLDFLQMKYQTEASMVIMLTTRKEKAKILNGISNREISLKNTLAGKEHSFTQCISPIWNEDGTVLDSNTNIVSRIVKQKRDFPNKPFIIHCEDGITKTGILMTVVNTVEELNFRNSINIFNVVKNLLRQRMKIVPTLACYTTCYSLMNEYCSIHL